MPEKLFLDFIQIKTISKSIAYATIMEKHRKKNVNLNTLSKKLKTTTIKETNKKQRKI